MDGDRWTRVNGVITFEFHKIWGISSLAYQERLFHGVTNYVF
jgi:hypothetical protein